MRSGSTPPVRTFETASPLPIPSRVIPVRVHTPSHGHRTPSPSHELDEPETIHPIPIRPSPRTPTHPTDVPLDGGWIPRADSRTSYIHMPPPHELQPIPTSPSSAATELRRTPQLAPTPVPPPIRSRDYAYQTSVPPSIPLGHAPSTASRTSTHISQYDLVNKRPGSSLRNEIYVGIARSGSQPSRESTSRNEHRSPHSSRTEAESIVEQWRADSDIATPPQNPPRSFVSVPLPSPPATLTLECVYRKSPSAVPHPHRPPHFYYQPRETMTPTPLGDVDDPRARTPDPTESAATQPDDPASHSARARSPLDYLRKRFRQQRPGSGSSSIPNIVVESPVSIPVLAHTSHSRGLSSAHVPRHAVRT